MSHSSRENQAPDSKEIQSDKSEPRALDTRKILNPLIEGFITGDLDPEREAQMSDYLSQVPITREILEKVYGSKRNLNKLEKYSQHLKNFRNKLDDLTVAHNIAQPQNKKIDKMNKRIHKMEKKCNSLENKIHKLVESQGQLAERQDEIIKQQSTLIELLSNPQAREKATRPII